MENVPYQYWKLVESGCSVFPMVYEDISDDDEEQKEKLGRAEASLREEKMAEFRRFQRLVLCRYDQFVPWKDCGG